MATFLDAAYAIVVEEYSRFGDPYKVPLHMALNAADELIGLPLLYNTVNGDEPTPSVATPQQAAQNDQALAELQRMMQGMTRA